MTEQHNGDQGEGSRKFSFPNKLNKITKFPEFSSMKDFYMNDIEI